MIPRWLAGAFWLLALVASTIFFARSFPELGETVATTFGADGAVTGSMTRSGYRLFYFGMLGVLNLIFVGLGVVGIRWLPFSVISVPNRDYWAAHPEEGRARIGSGMLIFGAGLNLLLAFSHLFILQRNGVETGWPGMSMGLYLGLVFGLLLVLFIQLLVGLKRPGA